MSKIEKLKNIAFAETMKNPDYKTTKMHLASIITSDSNTIVGKGHNHMATSRSHACSCHAEMASMSEHLRRTGLFQEFQKELRKDYCRTNGVLRRVSLQHECYLRGAEGKGG